MALELVSGADFRFVLHHLSSLTWLRGVLGPSLAGKRPEAESHCKVIVVGRKVIVVGRNGRKTARNRRFQDRVLKNQKTKILWDLRFL